ncbi:hypothetical protein J6590_028476 [Homalodisca vitripennis]|nr:hypothetical protein J6590_028476 [Homalodisca vitripennis]
MIIKGRPRLRISKPSDNEGERISGTSPTATANFFTTVTSSDNEQTLLHSYRKSLFNKDPSKMLNKNTNRCKIEISSSLVIVDDSSA